MKRIIIPVCIAIVAVLLLFCFGTGEQNTEPIDMQISTEIPVEKTVVRAQVVTPAPTAEPTKEIPHATNCK